MKAQDLHLYVKREFLNHTGSGMSAGINPFIEAIAWASLAFIWACLHNTEEHRRQTRRSRAGRRSQIGLLCWRWYIQHCPLCPTVFQLLPSWLLFFLLPRIEKEEITSANLQEGRMLGYSPVLPCWQNACSTCAVCCRKQQCTE